MPTDPSLAVLRGVRAVLMDLDGTLYHQGPLRRRMARELLGMPLRAGPRTAARTLRRLRAFRSVREELRGLGRAAEPLEEVQYAEPARRLRDDPGELRATVLEWMHRRPLRHLLACSRPELAGFLEAAERRGLELGVFSDYPADEKLVALGLQGRFSLSLCATQPEINAFKPHPRGFERACELWNLEPREVLYVGDRPEVDGAGARAAGMAVWIVGDDGNDDYPRAADLSEVRRAIGG